MIKNNNYNWKSLYKTASKLSLIMLILIALQIIVFVVSPPPTTVEGFYDLFKSNWLLGLLSLDFLYIINNTILIFIYLALFIRLFKENNSLSLIAFVVGLVGIACYFSSNISFDMLTLSSKYFSSTTIDQPLFLAAGEALIANYTGTVFDVYYVLNAITLLLFSKIILDSGCFKKVIGWWGLISGVLMIIPSSAGMIGLVFSLLSLIPWIIFLAYLMKEFTKLGNE